VLAEAHRVPQPPYSAGLAEALAGATSMLDVSDGLVQDAGHLADSSGVVIALDTSALAIDGPVGEAASAFNVDPLGWVLGGGDDHALLATFPPRTPLPEGFVAVGEVRAGEPAVLVDDAPYAGSAGHDHFAS
jgi:thiamine-monophosphate kinase